MELFKPLAPVIPVFFLIAVGFVFAHWKKISLAPLTELIVYLGTPSLVFTSLTGKPLVATDIAVLFAFGQPGMQRATLLFVIITSFQYSLGIYILTGGSNRKEIFRLPLLYAMIAGPLFNLGQIGVTEVMRSG